eukprot:TRINITY_DN6548_c2_g1_i1.p1 TRINITY_DN6548_c2_g1~~TRINITY_DN6548_c2_g1_i1.p1  ORF type:complete len:366 (+),score=61.75 TRINITY_DN6548_c2_g1_i1:41-1138(+)
MGRSDRRDRERHRGRDQRKVRKRDSYSSDSSSSSSSTRSSEAERRRKRKEKRENKGSQWGMTSAPEAAPPPEAFGKTAETAGSLYLAGTSKQLERSSLHDELHLSGNTARIAMMQKLQVRDQAAGVKQYIPSVGVAPLVQPQQKKKTTNPLMDGDCSFDRGYARKPAAKPVARAEPPKHPAEKQPSAKRKVVLLVPSDKCGILIGKAGKNHASLEAKYGCTIIIPNMDISAQAKVTVSGNAVAVEGAKRDIELMVGTQATKTFSDTLVSSNVISLTNMVANPDDIDEELVDSVRSECVRFGTVKNILVYDEHQNNGQLLAMILVQFSSPDEALATLKVMDERRFDGRVVSCVLYCEDEFLKILQQ